MLKHCSAVRQLAAKSISLKQKRQLLQQEGSGLISAIVAPILASILISAFTNGKNDASAPSTS